ncbi:hypothetical protein SAMN05216567_103172 [Variovorax sp. OK605]|jgi:hypothetical protein|uniref:hypothetical protein n=1 Tax=Variovorax sp. OK605 TaxID=1855317 RepID=UPI0008E56CEA|nr:hypothetical protein [Variovorax sp. OK605]SFO88144.1 hypothetical protein SAMN05216567_103172 [Variovorax sp. OK605]
MKSQTRSMIFALLAIGSVASATVASAAGPRRGDGGGNGIYQQELSVCGHNQQDRAACIREAGAARQEAARGGLTGAPDYRANALARCGLQQPADRADCEARVLGGAGNTRAAVDGSVMGGGVIRESVTTTVMPAPVVMPGPAVMPAPMPRPMERAPAPMIAPMPAPMR